MPVFQGQIIQSCGQQGWSNTFYINAADAASAEVLLDGINTAQKALQGSAVNIEYLRVSNVEIKGDGYLSTPSSIVGGLSLAGTAMDDLNHAAHFEFWDATFTHRVSHYVHGLRAADVGVDGDFRLVLQSGWTALPAVAAYIAAVKANSVNWQKRTIPPTFAVLASGNNASYVSIRRVGRPFGLPRGRRRTA